MKKKSKTKPYLLFRDPVADTSVRNLYKSLRKVSNRSWKPHIAKETACNRQFPSPTVDIGKSFLHAETLGSAHQFRTSVKEKEFHIKPCRQAIEFLFILESGLCYPTDVCLQIQAWVKRKFWQPKGHQIDIKP